MKSIFKSSSLVILLIGFFWTVSCKETKKQTAYQCPMQCQGDTTYDAPGKCPVCEMDLEPIEKK